MDGYKYENSMVEEYDEWREKELLEKPVRKRRKVTAKTYHTLKNRYLTRSRIQDFYKCKDYFNKKHILGEIVGADKDVFKIGSAVDVWLTKSKKQFEKKFVAVERRNLKNPPKNYTELTMPQYQEVYDMCTILETQPAYLDVKKHKAQQILTYDMPIGKHFIGFAVMPDWIHFDGDTCIITDLKTGNNVSPRKWHYHCEDYGYYLQFATIAWVVRMTRPEIKNFVYRHLVIDKDQEVKIPYVFYIDNERVERYITKLVEQYIPEISQEELFLPKQVRWEEAETIGEVVDY